MRLASTARFFVERGQYRRGEHWGYEVRVPAELPAAARAAMPMAGGRRAPRRRRAVIRNRTPRRGHGLPVPGGPAFLIGANFFAVKSYNPSTNYALALCHLGDRCVGGAALRAEIPGQRTGADARRNRGNPAPAQRARLRHRRRRRPHRHATTMRCAAYQRKIGMEPADGYAGVGLLARLRKGS